MAQRWGEHSSKGRLYSTPRKCGHTITGKRLKSGERGRNRTYNLLIKSHGSRCDCGAVNCSHPNNLTIKRPAWTVSESVGKVGGIEPHLTAKDTKKTHSCLALFWRVLSITHASMIEIPGNVPGEFGSAFWKCQRADRVKGRIFSLGTIPSPSFTE
jgi:hypothetical protein